MDENDKLYIRVPVDGLLDRIYDRQDKLVNSVHEINVTLAKQHISLEEHIKRSKAAEDAIELIRNEIKPIERHVELVKFAIKVVAGIFSSAGIVYLIKYFIK